MRFFRATAQQYESIRAMLDTAYGYPNQLTRTETAIPPVDRAIRDPQGRAYLDVPSVLCVQLFPSEMLPIWISTGAIEEIAEGDYTALVPRP
jgi:hypothetical protein